MITSNASLVLGQWSPRRWALLVSLASASAASATFPLVARAACNAACEAQFVAAHNASRTKLNNGLMPGPAGTFQPTSNPALGAFTLNDTAAGTAQAYADSCNGLTHSPRDSVFRGPNTGENIFVSSPTAPTPAIAVQKWEDESNFYIYATNSSTDPADPKKQVGHYTQLVWSSTTAVGCGVSHCAINSPFGGFNNGEYDLVVCQYTPAGNFVGERPYVAGVPAPGGALDADGNGLYDPYTDGLLILRYLFGITGPSLTNGALGPGATANTPALALARMDTFRPQYDIDGNTQFDAMTDGLLMVRYLFGLTGTALTNGAVGASATRPTALTIEPHLLTLRP